VYQDNFLKGFPKTVYKNQLVDIDTVLMPEYIDSSPEPSNTDLISFIENTQAREKFTVNLTLQFYVAGLPRYKIENFIQTLSSQNKNLITTINGDINTYKSKFQQSNSGLAVSTLNQLESLGYLLQEITKDIQEVQKSLNQP